VDVAARPLTIVVSGMVAAVPHQGGATWAVLQYLLGFAGLGHDVYFVEPLEALQPVGAGLADSVNARYCRGVMDQVGLDGRWALVRRGTRETAGLRHHDLTRVAQRADVLVNISGTLTDAELTQRIPTRVYLDLDPGFTQLWQAAQGIDMGLEGHTHFVTVGQAIGSPDCPVPTCGRPWVTTPQPVLLDRWPVADRIVHDGLTTVANWRGYGSIEHEGVVYGQKVHSLRRFMTLPARTEERFLLALAIHPDEHGDLTALRANGWELLDPGEVAGSPGAYQRFVQGSKAEFGVAKSGYVASRCGWFSDRSLCYLASGRPVLAQQTGFGPYIPTGEGLLAFETADDVLAGIDELNRDYARHAAAARALAEQHFDSGKVLTRLLRAVGALP
jgi:hypothetical protein